MLVAYFASQPPGARCTLKIGEFAAPAKQYVSRRVVSISTLECLQKLGSEMTWCLSNANRYHVTGFTVKATQPVKGCNSKVTFSPSHVAHWAALISVLVALSQTPAYTE